MDAGKESLLAFTEELTDPSAASITQHKATDRSLDSHEPFCSSCSSDANSSG